MYHYLRIKMSEHGQDRVPVFCTDPETIEALAVHAKSFKSVTRKTFDLGQGTRAASFRVGGKKEHLLAIELVAFACNDGWEPFAGDEETVHLRKSIG
jgi:hypothetical protein